MESNLGRHDVKRYFLDTPSKLCTLQMEFNHGLNKAKVLAMLLRDDGKLGIRLANCYTVV